jgi:DNA-binding transcriptional LysR family regulator
MESKQLEYIIKIAEECNITHAAEKLFITQSALNQQLLKLEKELGAQLFHRSRTNWRPTKAGEIYIKNAQEILRIKRETYRIINDIADTKKGHLSVGLTPGRGIVMFTSVYPTFHRLYPHIVVEPIEMSVKKQQQLVSQGNLDIAFMTLCDKHKTNDAYIKIHSEEFLLAIPKNHRLSYLAGPPGEPLSTLDISELKEDPFVLMYKESTSRDVVDEVFEKSGVTPRVLFETSSTSTIITMVESKLCCGLIPRYYTQGRDNMICFSLPQKPSWDVAVSYKKDSYLSCVARDFINLAKNYWSNQQYLQ